MAEQLADIRLRGPFQAAKVKRLRDGRVLVCFPDAFQGLVLEMKQIDGAWLLVRLPGK